MLMKSFDNPFFDVKNQVNGARVVQVNENRTKLVRIIKSIIVMMVLFNNVKEQKCVVSINEGNFQKLLRFRVKSGDEVLKEHLACIGDEIKAVFIN